MTSSALFLSLNTVKASLPIKTGVTSYDTELTAIMRATGAQIEHYCNRVFESGTNLTEYLDAKDRHYYSWDIYGFSTSGRKIKVEEQILYLSRPNVDSLANFEIYYDHSREFSTSLEEIDSENYHVDYKYGKIYLRWPTVRGKATIKIVYSAGYATSGNPANMEASLPHEVKQAFLVQTIANWTRSRSQNIGVLADRTDNRDPRIDAYTRYSVLGGLVPEAQFFLAAWRRPAQTTL